MTEYIFQSLDDYLSEHEDAMRTNATKCVQTNNIDYFIKCYVEACTPGGKSLETKYSTMFCKQYFLEKEDGNEDKQACIEALIYIGKELLSYRHEKETGTYGN